MFVDGYKYTPQHQKETVVSSLKSQFPESKGYQVHLMLETASGTANKPGDQVHGNWKFNTNDYPNSVQYGVTDGVGYIVTRKPSVL